MEYFIIDGIGPFFRGVRGKRINWSKVPFARIEEDGRLPPERRDQIERDFDVFLGKAAEMGYNGVTLDDLAHMTPAPFYAEALNRKIEDYRALYRALIDRAKDRGFRVFITTDIMFYNEALERRLGRSLRRAIDFLRTALDALFGEFPGVSGVILRVGEADGNDVKDEFHSRLALKTSRQARQCLRDLLPVFERHDRLLIFRTWSVGIHPIGDLIWNRDTFRRTFQPLRSPNLIVSMKYGESDFFRYLPLNEQFFRTEHAVMIELQARREYEGFGEFPSFVGWDYAGYAERLRAGAHLSGITVWCQTGGWGKPRRLTFLEDSSVWNEINTWVSIRVFKDGETAEEAVTSYCGKYLPNVNPEAMIRLLRLSDEVIKELLYIDAFALRKIFFRRLRVPPLISVFWDRIIISHTMRKVLRCFVSHGDRLVRQGRHALEKIRLMQELAENHGLPDDGLEYMYDTFEILAVAREYYFLPYTDEIRDRIKALKKQYKKKYDTRYSISTDFTRVPLKSARLERILALLLRQKRGYRLLLDQIFTIRVMAWLFPLMKKWRKRLTPKFARKQAMGIDAVFR